MASELPLQEDEDLGTNETSANQSKNGNYMIKILDNLNFKTSKTQVLYDQDNSRNIIVFRFVFRLRNNQIILVNAQPPKRKRRIPKKLTNR